jgi:hypothetical protein
MADPRNLEDVKAVKRRHEADIIKRYQAIGMGIGKVGAEYVFVVYLPAKRTDIKEPVLVEGVRLKFEVTGRIKTQ